MRTPPLCSTDEKRVTSPDLSCRQPHTIVILTEYMPIDFVDGRLLRLTKVGIVRTADATQVELETAHCARRGVVDLGRLFKDLGPLGALACTPRAREAVEDTRSLLRLGPRARVRGVDWRHAANTEAKARPVGGGRWSRGG